MKVYTAVNPEDVEEGTVIESRQAIAARNVEEILDATERLLLRGAPVGFSAVAAEAGLSRPTVYGHFPDRAHLLAALHERSVRRAVTAVESAGPDQGAPVEALKRVVQASWANLARHHDIARAVASELTGDAMHAGHHDAMALFERLIQRGRSEGAFRHDMPLMWLVNACVGLVHTAAATVHRSLIDSDTAGDVVSRSIVELCVGPTEAGASVGAKRRRTATRTGRG